MRLIVLSFCLMAAALGGCGIKPRNVDPPPGVKEDSFPKTYPNPSTYMQP